MSRSYIKIYGPPVLRAIKALESVAVDMSRSVELRFSNRCIPYPGPGQETFEWQRYVEGLRRTYVDCYEPVRLISEAHEMLGDYDFFFEWSGKPKMDQLMDLIGRIDNALRGLGCLYTITTK
jgi:hypothetical protein